jgi:UDP-N-acetylmuramate: L-alanyl-gamma-D-glutamyl-meso-diaminopimelate ligase
MHIHILGICGTFMGGIALLAREQGVRVSGSDANVYPPMSTQLQEQGIVLHEGYAPDALSPAPDRVVIGNALSRGNPAVERVLNERLAYTSGPQWLAEHVLADRWVLAVAGTHGKTSTASLLAWILEYAGLSPGFLIGGIPANFGVSARLGGSPFFVVEADEYDTAFFDKRSKFVHYRPRTLIINNIEFDHADIFDDLNAIKKQFHHLVRTVPGNGLIISPASDHNVNEVMQKGCWTPIETFGAQGNWQAQCDHADGSQFQVQFAQQTKGTVNWRMLGQHNVDNALAAIAAARHAGVTVAHAIESLNDFEGIKRRMEVRAIVNDITVYDDFAHHPTAIETTLQGLRNKVGAARIHAVLEPRSNTMRMGVHANTLAGALRSADQVYLYEPANLGWSLDKVVNDLASAQAYTKTDAIIAELIKQVKPGEHIIIMSNGGFENIHQRLIEALRHSSQGTAVKVS